MFENNLFLFEILSMSREESYWLIQRTSASTSNLHVCSDGWNLQKILQENDLEVNRNSSVVKQSENYR